MGQETQSSAPPPLDSRRMCPSRTSAWSPMTRSAKRASVTASRCPLARATSALTRSPSLTLAAVDPQSSRNAIQVSSSTATRATRAPGYAGVAEAAATGLPVPAGVFGRALRRLPRLAIHVACLYTQPDASACPSVSVRSSAPRESRAVASGGWAWSSNHSSRADVRTWVSASRERTRGSCASGASVCRLLVPLGELRPSPRGTSDRRCPCSFQHKLATAGTGAVRRPPSQAGYVKVVPAAVPRARLRQSLSLPHPRAQR